MSNKNNIQSVFSEYIKWQTFVILLFILSTQTISYSQVIVVLQQPPPFQFKIEQMWKVTLVNPTQTTFTVSLHGKAIESVEGLIVDATSATFKLPPGTKIISPRDLFPLNVNVGNSRFADVVKNIGGVPTGDYEICITVINTETGFELGSQCVQTQVQNLSQIELLEPSNSTTFLGTRPNIKNNVFKNRLGDGFGKNTNEEISNNEKQEDINSGSSEDESFFNTTQGVPFFFNWLAPTPIPPGARITYRLRIAEIYGNQSAFDAISSNPAFFEIKNIATTMLQYPTSARQFKSGISYAWKVDLFLNNVFISGSEIWKFTIAEDKPKDISSNLSANKFQLEKDLLQNEDHQPIQVASIDFTPENFFFLNRFSDEAQVEESPIQFSGNFRFNVSSASRIASFSEQPKNYWTAELNPKLSFYGLPFTANFLLSSQQDASRQSINSFGFNFDFNTFREQIKSKLEDKIGEVTSGWENFFMSVTAFGIGTNYPSYSDFTLSGVPVTGLNIEINPGIFYAAFSGSNSQRGINNSSYKRSLYAGRIGLGKKEGTHLFFTGLYAKDDETSIELAPNNNRLTPKANYVFGTEFKLNLFQEKLSLQSEAAVAVLTRDTRDPELEHKSIPSWIKNLVDPRISTSIDYSYSGKLAYNNNESATKIALGIKMVGPGYASLGVPNLRTDQFGYDGKFDQQFFERKISLGTFYKRSNDNLIKWKRSTTTTTAYGINLGFTFPSIPFLRISYSPYSQKNDDVDLLRKIQNTTSIYSVITGYSYQIGDVNSSTSLMFSGQQTKTFTGLDNYRTKSFTVTEAITLNIPLSFTASWGLIQTTSVLGYSRINNFDLGANSQITEEWSIMAGINIATQKDLDRRTGFYLNSIIVPMQGIEIDLRADRNIFTEDQFILGNYREFIFSATLTASW